MGPACPSSVSLALASATFHSITLASSPAVTSVRPSGVKRASRTGRVVPAGCRAHPAAAQVEEPYGAVGGAERGQAPVGAHGRGARAAGDVEAAQRP